MTNILSIYNAFTCEITINIIYIYFKSVTNATAALVLFTAVGIPTPSFTMHMALFFVTGRVKSLNLAVSILTKLFFLV